MKPPRWSVVLLASALAATAAIGRSDILIDGSFPGGNVVVERIETNRVYLRQDLRDTIPGVNWFYWHFRARNTVGGTVRFHFLGGSAVSSRGPAVSLDHGLSWSWLGMNHVWLTTNGFDFDFQFPPGSSEVRFCVAPAYVQSDLDRFLARHARNPALSVERLCQSRKGRPVELLRLGRLEDHPPLRVLLTARHHACESIASFTLEGLLESVLSNKSDGSWLRRNAQFVVIPFMDKDGVEEGDQGKSRAPRDHWQDYSGESLYPEVAALKRLVSQWPPGSLRVALDLHCPSLRGIADEPGDAEWIFFVDSMRTNVAAHANAFQRILERDGLSPLRYFPRHNLSFGARWNTAAEMAPTCLTWASDRPEIEVATLMEIPYATAGGEAVTADSARSLGRDLAPALRRFLESRVPRRAGVPSSPRRN